jgi:hypothetical protein
MNGPQRDMSARCPSRYLHAKMRKQTLVMALLGLYHFHANAQGCSDAGVCSAGAIGQVHLWQDSTADVVDYRHYARVLYSYAIGEQGVTVMQVQPELSIGITDRLSLQMKVPFVSTNGNLGDNSGIGDAIVSTSYAFIKEQDRDFTGTLGLRLPTGSTDAMAGGIPIGTQLLYVVRPLPMPYQTGLGTTDRLLAAQYRYKRWTTAIAYQHVLDQANKNTFSHEAWDGNTDARGYFESYHLERANDLVGRIQYAYGCGRLSLQPGLLGIYHIGMDSRLVLPQPSVWSNDTTPFRWVVSGSQGLTLNLTADLRYKLSEQWAIEAMFGAPVVTREVRPDGLTRSLVTGFGLRYRF